MHRYMRLPPSLALNEPSTDDLGRDVHRESRASEHREGIARTDAPHLHVSRTNVTARVPHERTERPAERYGRTGSEMREDLRDRACADRHRLADAERAESLCDGGTGYGGFGPRGERVRDRVRRVVRE